MNRGKKKGSSMRCRESEIRLKFILKGKTKAGVKDKSCTDKNANKGGFRPKEKRDKRKKMIGRLRRWIIDSGFIIKSLI